MNLLNRFFNWLTTDRLIDLATTAVAAAGVLFVALAGIVLSYSALYDLAGQAQSINTYLVWLWPLTLDALAIVASLNVLWAEIRQERDPYAWSLVLAFTALSVVFNATHAGLDELLVVWQYSPIAIAALVGILPPIAGAFALHLLVRLLRRVLERVSVIAAIGELAAQAQQARQDLRRTTEKLADLQTKRDALARDVDALRKDKRNLKRSFGEVSDEKMVKLRAFLAERSALGDEPTGAAVARFINVSDRLGRKLKRELWPEVTDGANGNGREVL